MISSAARAPVGELERTTGWAVTEVGACRGDVCVPLPDGTLTGGLVDLALFSERMGMPLLHDAEQGLWSLGPPAGGKAMTTVQAPELTLPTLDGEPFSLSSLRGRKVLIVSWASWCGCRLDLPVWQELRTELAPSGFELLSVAMDTGGADAARPFAEGFDFPVVVDSAHLLGELFGVVNVPSGIWVDEDGVVVRPPETAYPAVPLQSKPDLDDPQVRDRLGEEGLARMRVVLPELDKMWGSIDPDSYVAALRDWVAHGSASRFALSADEVLGRSRPRDADQATAAAAFALGEHLHRAGEVEAAVRWFRQSHRLQPDNWTYRRQAWSLADPKQGPTEQYDSDWLSDFLRGGGDNYYESLELEPRR